MATEEQEKGFASLTSPVDPGRVKRHTEGGAKTGERSYDWRIWISGYGTFDFIGTEAEAEERRAAKAQWEGAKGMKWRLSYPRPSDALTAEIVDLWASGEGVPRGMLQDRAAALRLEADAGAQS